MLLYPQLRLSNEKLIRTDNIVQAITFNKLLLIDPIRLEIRVDLLIHSIYTRCNKEMMVLKLSAFDPFSSRKQFNRRSHSPNRLTL